MRNVNLANFLHMGEKSGGWASSVDKDLVEKYPAVLALPGMPIREFGDWVGEDFEAADGLGREFNPIIG